MTTTPVPAEPPRHHAVVHPRELLHKQPGITHRDLLGPEARGFLGKLSELNTRAAVFVCACYGSALAVWLFALFAIVSGLAKGSEQITLLTWSNGVQLVFCAVGTLASLVTQKQGQAKADADHAAQTHIATMVDASKADLAVALDRLDSRTEGGIADVLAAVHAAITMIGHVQDAVEPGHPLTAPAETLERPEGDSAP